MENKTIRISQRIISLVLIWSMIISMIPYIPASAVGGTQGIGIYNHMLTSSDDIQSSYNIYFYTIKETPLDVEDDDPVKYSYSYEKVDFETEFQLKDTNGQNLYLETVTENNQSNGRIQLNKEQKVNFISNSNTEFKRYLIDHKINCIVIELIDSQKINNNDVKIFEQYSVQTVDGSNANSPSGDPASIPAFSDCQIYKINYVKEESTNNVSIENENNYTLRQFDFTPMVDWEVNVNWRDTDPNKRPSNSVEFDVSRTTETGDDPAYTDYTTEAGTPEKTSADSNNDIYTYSVPERDKDGNPYHYKAVEQDLPTEVGDKVYNSYDIVPLGDDSFQNFSLTTFSCEFYWWDEAHKNDITKNITPEFIKANFQFLDETDADNPVDLFASGKIDDAQISYDAETGQFTISGLREITAEGTAKVYSLKPKATDSKISVDTVDSSASYAGHDDDSYLISATNSGVCSSIVDRVYDGSTMNLLLTGQTTFEGALVWADTDKRTEREDAVSAKEAGDFMLYRYVGDKNDMVSQVGTWKINEGDEYFYTTDGTTRTPIDKYDNTGAEYFYFAKERLTDAEYGVDYSPVGNSHSDHEPFKTQHGIYNEAEVFPNGATVKNSLEGEIAYGVDAQWIAAELQGGTGEVHYQLQKYTQIVDDEGNPVLDENNNPTYHWVDIEPILHNELETPVTEGKVDLTGFSAELMELDGVFYPVHKYDENGHAIQYRVVQTSASRTDNGQSGTYEPDIAMAYDANGHIITVTQTDGRALVTLIDPNDPSGNTQTGTVRIKIGNNEFDVRVYFDSRTNTFEYKYQLVGKVKIVMNKDWDPVPQNQLKDVWNSRVTLKLLKYNYTSGNYEEFDATGLKYTYGTKENGSLVEYTANGSTIVVDRNKLVDDIDGIAAKYAVKILNAPMYDEEGHLNKYSIAEVKTEVLNEDTNEYEVKTVGSPIYSKSDEVENGTNGTTDAVDVFTARNIFGDGGERIYFHKVWMDDGEEEYKCPIGVYMTPRAMPLPIPSNRGVTVANIENYNRYESIVIPESNNNGWAYTTPWTGTSFNDWTSGLGYRYTVNNGYVNKYSIGNNTVEPTENANYKALPTSGNPVSTSDFSPYDLSNDILTNVNNALTTSNGKMMDTGGRMNEDTIWTARVEVRIGYSYNNMYNMKDFQEQQNK